ncbi:hypothetical protein [Tsukamurella sp. USMM236]|uniref:hypothetical protein n=1 Tax=Tsukamurella sp. USMM236 TaxID=3081301 RepID=UPI00301AB3FF
MTDTPQVSVHVQSGAGEIVRLVATMMLVGGAMSVAWAVARTGYAELAGSGLAVMLVTAAKLLWKRGMIVVPEQSASADGLAETRSTMKRLTAEWAAFLGRASVPAIVLLSIAYAIGFLALRAGVIKCLTVFSNPWIAGGVGAIVGAFLVAPRLFPSIAAAMKSKPAPAAPDPAPTPPTSPAPAPASPVQPAPIVVRRKTPKENENV